MRLDRAKEILALTGKGLQPPSIEEHREAQQLGYEALELLIKWRDKAEIQPYPLLRSETLE